MPLSWSSAGTPRSGKAQQLLPSAIIPIIRTRIGSERALPKATSCSTRSSEITSGVSARTLFSTMTAIFWLANICLPFERLLSPDEGARGRYLSERLALLWRVEAFYGLGIVDVLDLHRDILEACLPKQRLVLLPLQSSHHAPRPQTHGLQHLVGELGLGAEKDHVGNCEAAPRLEDTVDLGDHLGLVGGEVYDTVGDD